MNAQPKQIAIAGGGPAGLYAAILLKKTHPDWTVKLYERNPRGATYGWGVVFSDRTLNALREADLTSYDEITESFALWDAIDVHVKGELVRINGQPFAGIGRRHLLEILTNRCEALGVELHFEHPVTGLEDLPEADLIIAADGVNSSLREELAGRFQPRVDLGQARYIWFGTDRTYDAFTFVFRDTEHGLFQAHAYPFDSETSTFIVECRQETWERTGLAEDDEDASVAFCEDLFAEHLGGHRLRSNRSHWLLFPTLHNRRWSAPSGHGNVVLLGDSAHTAHFSIGSGTKLAMEDAIGLAEAFERHDDVTAALRDYEMARRPRVQIIQDAARESQDYFEHVARYHHLQPRQFSYHLMTRSGRITHDNLRTRDPYFVAACERWFASQADQRTAATVIAPPPLFTPFAIGNTTFANRIVVTESPGLATTDGIPAEKHTDHYAALAAGHPGAIITAPLAVTAGGRIAADDAGLYDERSTASWSGITANVHECSDALVIARLNHAGRRGSTRPRRQGLDLPLRRSGWELLAPSPVAFHPQGATPREMTGEDMAHVRQAFTDAAQSALEADFDGLLLDMSHGYLLSSFLSPATNRRDDDYGGSLEDRLRFPLEVMAAARAIWPQDRSLLVALNGSDRLRNGLTPADAVYIARELRKHGCDLLMVRAGQVALREQYDFDANSLAQLSDIIRNESGLPTLATGYMDTSNQPNTLLAGGRADLCLIQSTNLTISRAE